MNSWLSSDRIELWSQRSIRALPFVFLFLSFLCLYLSLCLATYDANDIQLIENSSSEIANAGGVFGVILSQLMFLVFGHGSWCVLLLGGGFAWRAAGRKTLPLSRLLACTALFICLLCLFALIGPVQEILKWQVVFSRWYYW